MIQPGDVRAMLIEATSHCNLHCPQCDRFDRQGNLNPDMTLAHLDLERVILNLEIDQLINLERLRFEGDHGDPVMHPDIDTAVASLCVVPRVSVVTNGGLRNPVWWRGFARHRNLTVEFAIDGLEDTNALYRINSDWRRTLANARAYIEAGGRAVWKYIVFGHNQHQVDAARQLSQTLGFADFVTEISNRNFYQQDRFPVYVDGVYQGRDLTMAQGVAVRSTTRVIMLQRMRDAVNYQAPTCTWLDQGQIYIDYLGHVIPCCMTSGLMWRRDITGQLWQRIVGDATSINIHDHTISDVLASPFYTQRLRESFQDVSTVHHACYANCAP